MANKTDSDRVDLSSRWRALVYLAALLVGAAVWPPLLLLGSCYFVAESTLRVYRALDAVRRVDVSGRTKSGARRVMALGMIAAGVSAVVAVVGISGLRDADRGLSANTVGLCAVLLAVRTVMENVASRLGKRFEVAPPFASDVRGGLDDAGEALVGNREGPPVFAAVGSGEAGRLGMAVSWMITGALIAAISGNSITPQNLPTAVRRIFGEDNQDSQQARPPRMEDGDDPQDGSSRRTSNDASPSPSTTPSPLTAAEYCGYEPHTDFAELPPPHVADAMIAAYDAEGALEIGCPDSGVKEDGHIYVAKLSRGQSDPSWVIGDDTGHAAVVFEDLVPLARRLHRHDVFAGVFPRQSTGAGDYQVFEKTDGSCILGIRNLYSQGYVVLPAPVTHAVMRLSILYEAFPYVEDLDAPPGLVGDGRFRASWTTLRQGRPVSEAIEMTKMSAPDVLRGAGAAFIDRGKCPDPAAFDAEAAKAREATSTEATAALGSPRRHRPL